MGGAAADGNATTVEGGEERGSGVPLDRTASPRVEESAAGEVDELERLSAELGDLSSATAEAFDLLGDDFDNTSTTEELLDAMDGKVDPFAAFSIADDDLLS